MRQYNKKIYCDIDGILYIFTLLKLLLSTYTKYLHSTSTFSIP